MMHVEKCFIPLGPRVVLYSRVWGVHSNPTPPPGALIPSRICLGKLPLNLVIERGISLSEGLSPVFPVHVVLHQPPPPPIPLKEDVTNVGSSQL